MPPIVLGRDKGKSVLGLAISAPLVSCKLYHTIEGGAVVSNRRTDLSLSKLRNFGFKTPSFDGIGINGKNSEFHAAMGLCNLVYANDILARRKEQFARYKNMLTNKGLTFQTINKQADYNYSYFPVVFESEEQLLKVKSELEINWIYPRRYFYPSLSTLDYLDQQATPISNDISKRILCLPLYHALTGEEQDLISRIIIRTMKY